MNEYAVITAMGSDRIGLVDDITEAFESRQCNIEESRMALLGGEFAIVLLVSGSAENLAALEEGIEATGTELGLTIHVKPTTSPHPSPEARPYLIESISLDSPGIVHAITSILRGYEVNIEDLETDTTSAPFTGAPMFVLKARISVPARVSVNHLRERIESLAEERDLDITMQPISVGTV